MKCDIETVLLNDHSCIYYTYLSKHHTSAPPVCSVYVDQPVSSLNSPWFLAMCVHSIPVFGPLTPPQITEAAQRTAAEKKKTKITSLAQMNISKLV